MCVSHSPRLFAAAHVLHRLSTPRHPPCALSSLTFTPKTHFVLCASINRRSAAVLGLRPAYWPGYSCSFIDLRRLRLALVQRQPPHRSLPAEYGCTPQSFAQGALAPRRFLFTQSWCATGRDIRATTEVLCRDGKVTAQHSRNSRPGFERRAWSQSRLERENFYVLQLSKSCENRA